jgi:hypothetical protein
MANSWNMLAENRKLLTHSNKKSRVKSVSGMAAAGGAAGD